MAQSVITVQRPTVIAFFPLTTDAQMEKDADLNEALADFQLYAQRVAEPLRQLGIDFHQVYGSSFRIRTGSSVTVFRSGKIKVGYYFIAPGKKARIQYGVDTDDDILHIAREHFGLAPK